MQIPEIDRNPPVPPLGEKATQLLTQLCFRPDDELEKADLIFGFSAPNGIEKFARTIRGLVEREIAKTVLIAGGTPQFPDSGKLEKAESEIVLDLIGPAAFPDIRFYAETKSTNTLENVTEALKVLDFSGFQKIVFVYKKHDARRGYLTLRKFLPHTKLIQHTFEPVYPGTDRPLTRDTWHTYDFGRSRVWGEYLRIKLYGERGDIYYDDEIRALVEDIEKII